MNIQKVRFSHDLTTNSQMKIMRNVLDQMKGEYIKESQIGDTLDMPGDQYMNYDGNNKYKF